MGGTSGQVRSSASSFLVGLTLIERRHPPPVTDCRCICQESVEAGELPATCHRVSWPPTRRRREGCFDHHVPPRAIPGQTVLEPSVCASTAAMRHPTLCFVPTSKGEAISKMSRQGMLLSRCRHPFPNLARGLQLGQLHVAHYQLPASGELSSRGNLLGVGTFQSCRCYRPRHCGATRAMHSDTTGSCHSSNPPRKTARVSSKATASCQRPFDLQTGRRLQPGHHVWLPSRDVCSKHVVPGRKRT